MTIAGLGKEVTNCTEEEDILSYEVEIIGDDTTFKEFENLPEGAYKRLDSEIVHVKFRNGLSSKFTVNKNCSKVYILEKNEIYGVLPDETLEKLNEKQLARLLPVEGYGKGRDTLGMFIYNFGTNKVNYTKLIQSAGIDSSIFDIESGHKIEDKESVSDYFRKVGACAYGVNSLTKPKKPVPDPLEDTGIIDIL